MIKDTNHNQNNLLQMSSNTENQRNYRKKIESGELRRLHTVITRDQGQKLDALTEHWESDIKATLVRLIEEAWEREGRPRAVEIRDGRRWRRDN